MRNLKRVLALALALVMVIGMMVIGSSAASYTDEAAIDAKYADAVEILTGMGVFQGTGAGFAPKSTLSRAEAATIIYRVITADVTNAQVDLYDYASFDDVEAGAWYTGYVTYAANGGYIKGYDGKFMPNDKVTGVQVAAIMLRAIGYGQNGEYEGAAWKDNVLTDAREAGLLSGISVKSLDIPATREIVAQLIWNAVNADMVTYTPALGYLPAGLMFSTTLGIKNFDLASDDDYDVWGRPSVVYYKENGLASGKQPNEKLYATIENEAIVTYTDSVKVCQVVADLGLKTNDTTQICKNSKNPYYSVYALNYLDTTTTLWGSGTGVLTEVYQLANGDYRIVEIDTYLAKVGTVTPAKTDANGHVTPASTALTVYATDAVGVAKTFQTADYTEGQYVLVNMTTDGVVRAVAPATYVTGAKTAYNTVEGTISVDGVAYKQDVNYYVGKTTVMSKTYNWFMDPYGNIIGAVEPISAKSYAIVTDIVWDDQSSLLSSATIRANLRTFDGAEIANVVVGSIDGKSIVAGTLSEVANNYTQATYGTNVSSNKNMNTAYTTNVYTYSVVNGVYHLTEVENAGYKTLEQTAAAMITNTPAITGTPAGTSPFSTWITNANTVYLVKTMSATGPVWTSYTGYTNVPTMTNAKVYAAMDKNFAYVSYVYVDATAATFAGSNDIAMIFDNHATGMANATQYTYTLWIDGAPVTKTALTSTLTGYVGEGLYKVSYDANGNIISVDATATGLVAITNVDFFDGTTLRTTAGQYWNGVNVALYDYDMTTNTIKAGTTAGVVATGSTGTVYAFTNAYGHLVAIYY